MGLAIETDRSAILALLDAAVAADPARHTILATIAGDVRAGHAGWCASDGAALAARSDADRPVSVTDGWSELDALAAALSGLPRVCGLGGPPEAVRTLVDLLGRPVLHRHDERLFRCDAVEPPAGVRGSVRRATAADAELLTAWRAPFLIDAFGRVPPGGDAARWAAQVLAGLGVWLWLDEAGEPVSQAAVRLPVAGVARIGPVYTPPQHRGRGYASAVTAVAAAHTLAVGAVPVLFTDLANPTSNKIYLSIGFQPVADRAAVWFE